jgi:hypothetical protein
LVHVLAGCARERKIVATRGKRRLHPYCAAGKRVRRRGARATAYRLRDGTCDGEPARVYTRALMRFPKAYGIAAMTLKLKTGCD